MKFKQAEHSTKRVFFNEEGCVLLVKGGPAPDKETCHVSPLFQIIGSLTFLLQDLSGFVYKKLTIQCI
ncbi:hypothetical protein ISN45_At05g061510 [Arabidopsis thaliana x Arabidopsis arenosa]|uniref:Uncharacterized protein n=2 Tax=Arabidopsis TaxID=3701 RepID=A0A8T2DQH2_ARASU|nr:hypothetical protein ISN45_At05g061510 [Arabidopsis thaliana x Arabidopsis arenosa]KAG7614268.1 hypothetical protein ISN44_As05g060790 [Arabidopsis suecica]